MDNHPTFRLGKSSPSHDARTLMAGKYMQALPPAPASVDWTGPVSFPCGMAMNDKLGDCTCAAAAHSVQLTTANANPPEVTLPDSAVLALYEAACGYNPADPSSDRGGVERCVLNYWRQNGIGGAGHAISAYAAVNPLNQAEVSQAINLFCFVYIGVMLPVSAQSQVGGVWDVDNTTAGAPGSWGGHAVIVCQYDPAGLTVITWGAKQRMTWDFWKRYVDEAYVCLTPDWIAKDGQSPSGFDLAALQADLALVSV